MSSYFPQDWLNTTVCASTGDNRDTPSDIRLYYQSVDNHLHAGVFSDNITIIMSKRLYYPRRRVKNLCVPELAEYDYTTRRNRII